MRRLNPIERVCMILATVFMLVGVVLIVHPTEAYVPHPGPGFYQVITGPDPAPEHLTKNGARIFGVAAIVMSGGLAWLAFYRGRQ